MAPTEILLPSVKSLLLSVRANGQEIGTATGFLAECTRGLVLLTNRHVVTGRHQETGDPLAKSGALPDSIRVLHNRSGRLGEWTWREEPLFASGSSRWHEHPRFGSRADFVALPLSATDDIEPFCYTLGEGDPAIVWRPADVVSVVGFPFGLQGGGSLAIWATGFVASEPDVDFRDLPVFFIDCRSRPGQSGSAVVAHRNSGMVALEGGVTAAMAGPSTRFLGIYSGRINAESDLGFVWKATALKELIASVT